MDGNGRWAKARGLERTEGHKEGIKSVRAAVEAAGGLGVKTLTLYTFSSENWARPKTEVSALMSLLLTTIRNEVAELDEKNVRLTAIGDIQALPLAARTGVQQTINRLRKNTGLVVNLALSYSGRQEIIHAVKQICTKVVKGEITPDAIDDEVFNAHLQTKDVGDPDLLIRTSGEFRISNFLLWQLAYTEFFISPKYWPDFREDDFLEAIREFQRRDRRFGKVRADAKPG
ncbi:isoprenyl transferase [candidate division KSB1 bacterium]|nr:isoprenyl transferase [candidate division KSB1 bacterium]